ncbi:MAG: radical SAM protein [Pseudodesulfovibrio sp.]|nr:radical SAM protein [Pseudodesulfovibrio sp.]
MTFEKLVSSHSHQTSSPPDRHCSNPAKFDGHLRIYPTLACNLRCDYCVNEQMGQRPAVFSQASPEAWVQAINREGRHVVLTGGEPFLYPGLSELINGVNADLKVRVYTNFCLSLRDVLDRIQRPVHFFISWHPQQRADRDTFLDNAFHMLDNPLFTADMHAIDAEETRAGLDADLDYFLKKGLTVTKDDDQRTFDGSCQTALKTAVCSKIIYLIGPDGTRFQCVSRLIRKDRPMENMLKSPLATEEAVSLCPDFGNCAPCDILGQTQMAVYNNGQEE